MTDQVRDSWSHYDYPVLKAIARRAEDSDAYMQFMSDNLLDEMVSPDRVDERFKFERALVRLTKGGYIESLSPMWGKPYPMHVTGITERGLRAVGAWPSPDSVVDDLLGRLEEQANKIEVSQPEKSKRLKEVVGFLATGAREVFVSVVGDVAVKAAGLK